MSELQTESPAALAGAHTGQVLCNLEHTEFTTMQAAVEAEAVALTAYEELSSINQWVSWKSLPPLPTSKAKKPRKVPICPETGRAASVDDPSTWDTFNRAIGRKNYDNLSGVGIVLIKANDLTMIDMDGCIDENGEVEPWAAEIVGFQETYCEISPSGKGLRMFARGTLDHAVAASDVGVELYSESRYCTVTGRRLPESPNHIAKAPRTIAALLARVEAMKGRREAERAPLALLEPAPEQSLSERARASAPAYDGGHADGDERAFIESALACIPSDNRDVWLKVGGVLHDTGEPWAKALWEEWARCSSKFNADDQEKTWASFSRPTGRKAGKGTIVYLARQHGFTGTKFDYGPDISPEYLESILGNLDKLVSSSAADVDMAQARDQSPVSNGADSGLKFYFDGEDATTPPPSLVKGLLPFEGIAMIAGQSGAGKTFIACYLAVMLASGKPFFGRKVAERVGVVIVAAEGAATIASRIHAAREDTNSDGELLPIAWLKEVPDLRQPASITQLAGALKARCAYMQAKYGVRLGAVFIDTLNAAFTMQDENSNAEAGAIMRSLHWLSKETGALVLPVHHYGKAAETGPRGASAWRAGCDAVLSVLADRNQITGKVSNRSLALAKSRVGEEGDISAFILQVVSQGLDADNEEITTCTVLPIEAEKIAEKSRKLSRGETAYLDALAVVSDKAEKCRPYGYQGPEIAAVDREAIRAEFYASWPADGATEKQKEEAKRKAFARGERGLLDRRQIMLRQVGGREMVWRLNEEFPQTSGTPDRKDTP
jgi:hypothetical protein